MCNPADARHRRLFLEKFVRRDRHRHFPRLRIDEVGQREHHAIDDAGNDGDGRQEAEQAGHRQGLREGLNGLERAN